MSEKKIQVPEGMLKAGIEAWRMDLPLSTFPSVTAANTTRMILEAALSWLSENPIVPTEDQSRMLEPLHSTVAACEWQRRMFLAPEPEDTREMTIYDCLDCKKSWKQQLRETIATCVYCQSAHTIEICTMSAIRDFKPEPEVPEAVKVLLLDEKIPNADFSRPTRRFFNDSILEAYRRGKESK